MASTSSARRAIGIVRVSQPGKRKGESFVSPKEQRTAIEAFCIEHGWQLLTVHDEMHVSGNALLEDRPGLSQAVMVGLAGPGWFCNAPARSSGWETSTARL